VRIRVADTGIGLDCEQLQSLFQPFNRLGQEASSEQGTGIGLVVCKRLIEWMGGAIGVESTPATGSVFWVDLLRTAQGHTGVGTAPSEPAVAVAVPAQSSTLLYIEDNPANLMLVEDLMLRRPDIRLLSARDASSGIEIARSAIPDVILMDINLPGISGIQALRILAEDPLTAHIPVLALSANAMPRDIEKGVQAGFFRYLTKPIKVREFMNTLDMTLEYARARAVSTDQEQHP